VPRINRIRVTNIQYDHGKKQLPDILFEPKGLDMVMLLANGGGKSLLIQLILQTVLPNEKMMGRRVSDLLQAQQYTGHIAVEWLLDSAGERRQFLCTGFCFSNGLNKEQKIRYYNYLFNYDDKADLTIANLPLTQPGERDGSKRPSRYQEFRDWLREEGIQVFDTINTYHERLRIFQILPEEWKNIRDTNGSEGGVDKFFEKSKTTQQLLDNLLIPSVEEMIFQSESKKKELFKAFSEHRGMLLEIPVIKQNLEDFKVIRDHADSVVAEGEKLDRLQKELAAKTRAMVSLAKTFDGFQEEAGREMAGLGLEREELSLALRELAWQRESYKVFVKQQDFQRALAEEEKAAEAYAGQEAVLGEARQKAARVKALYYFNEAEEAAGKEKYYRNQLELMDQDEPELRRQLEEQSRLLKGAWEGEKNRLEDQRAAAGENLRNLGDELKGLEELIAEARREEGELRESLAGIRAWFSQYNACREDLHEFVGEEEILNPEEGLRSHEGALANYRREEEELKALRQELGQRLEGLDREINHRRLERNDHGNRLAAVREKLAKFGGEEAAVGGLLSQEGRFVRSLLAEKEEALLWVRDLLQEARGQRAGIQAELANLEEKWALLEGKDYYIPHHDLIKIKNRLEKAGLSAVLGSEWLAAQNLSGEEKEGFLKNQPLLPFAIIIEGAQVNGVKNLMKQGREWSCDIPLLFLVKSERSLSPAVGTERFLPLWQEELFLYQPESVKVYTSREAFQTVKDQLEERIESKREDLRVWGQRENELLYLSGRVEGFYRQYTVEEVTAWEEAEKNHLGQLEQLAQQIAEGEKNKEALKGEAARAEEALAELMTRRQQETVIIEKLQGYCRLHRLLPGKQAEEREKARSLELIGRQIAGWEQRKTGVIGQQSDLRNAIREFDRLLEVHHQEFRHYGLDRVEAAQDVDLAYADVKPAVEGIMARLASRQSDRGNILELINTHGKKRQDAMYQVENTGVELSWLEAHRRTVTREEVRDADEAVKVQEDILKEKEKSRNDAETNTKSAQTLLDHLVAEVRAEFAREPYDGFSPLDHELEYRQVKEKIRRLKEREEAIDGKIKELQEWQRENREAYEAVVDKLGEETRRWWEEAVPYTRQEWEALGRKPRKAARRMEIERDNIAAGVEKQKNILGNRFGQYLHKLESTQNPRVKQFIRDVRVIMDDNRLYDYDFVQTQFLRIFEGLDEYQRQFEITLTECENNKRHLIDLCLRRATAVYDSIVEIPKNSRVNIFGRDIQVIRMDWKVRDERESREKMDLYFEQILKDLQRWKQEGMDDDVIDRRLEDLLKTRNLVQIIAPMEECRITVYKPRQEAVARLQKPDFSLWDEVSLWSGGEEYSIYITMFMIMITHIRQQTEGRQNVWKVIVADNPFGKASSPHILETIFQVARSNRIQLICLTAHKQDDILKRFPVVYSLQLRNAYGKEIMQVERMETGFYRFEAVADDKAQMMLLV